MNKYYKFIFSFTIWIFVFTLITIIISLLDFNIKYISKIKDKNYLLYYYQTQKLLEDKKNPSTIAFIGDSSLGNSIDSKHFAELSGKKVINLALNESYGFSGQYNILRQLIKINKPEKIILFNSISFLKSNTENEAFYLTSKNFLDIFEAYNKISFIKFYYSYLVKFFIAKLEFDLKEYKNFYNKNIYLDYIKQSNKKPNKIKNEIKFNSDNLKSRFYYLNLIKKLCDEKNIKIVQIYGPISKNFFIYSDNLVEQNKKFYESFNFFSKINEQIVIEENQLGDDYMHVNYENKNFFTKKFYNLLKDKL